MTRSSSHRRIIRRRVRFSEVVLGPLSPRRRRAAATPAAMVRPKKHIAASRKNGSKATNYGKIKAEPTVVFKESYVRNGAALDVTFEKVLRAKLHKNVKYFDEWRAEQRLASASQLVRAAFLPGSKQDCAAASRVASARSWLQAYSAATSATS